MLFVEGKWFYNYVLNIHQAGIKLKDINTTAIQEVEHFDKDKQKVISKLDVFSS